MEAPQEVVYLNPKQLAQLLEHVIRSNLEREEHEQPVHVWIEGRPGEGKTDVARQVGAAVNSAPWFESGFAGRSFEMPYIPPACVMDSVDMLGLPGVDRKAKTMEWYPPKFWPSAANWLGVIFADELPQGSTAVQCGFMQLTCGGRLGDYVVPRGATFIVSGNRAGDKAGVVKTPTALLDRFLRVGLTTDNASWQEWAIANNVHSSVRHFMNFRPALLSAFDPQKMPSPTPRGWHRVSRIVKSLVPRNLLQAAVQGCVGMSGAEYVGFLEIFEDLPNVAEVLANPAKHKVPDKGIVQYALAGAISDFVRDKDEKVINAAVTFHSRMPEEISVMCMRDMILGNRACSMASGTKDWLRKHKSIVLDWACSDK